MSQGSSGKRSDPSRSSASRELTSRPETRLLDGVREHVATNLAFRATKLAISVDGVKVGVALTRTRSDDERFLRHVASKIKQLLLLNEFLFIVAPSGPHIGKWPMIIVGSTVTLVEKASTLVCAKFLGRMKEIRSEGARWIGYVEDVGSSDLDEGMLWDVVRKTSHVVNPKNAPSGSRSIDEILGVARTRLERITPKQALDELRDLTFPLPVVIVDIRPAQQREEHGEIPESLVVERNVLEWRFDPRSDARLSIADRYDLRIIIFCQEGYASSLAAASLHDLGLLNATDIIGGYKAWKEAGLPTFMQPSPSLYSK
ncbi:hypothetical protein SCHPADRAFT_916386 [Schizopora paradoxa]|uniref:Rhodanese domain-containing protein n=1 Tax=Schizopora paradoxa TaxID=27342 RepID=A0A0H2RLP9_9AGAM|nr:hypothetical protein SCHPADRAFT_916386 [Schizopora paradoxa]